MNCKVCGKEAVNVFNGKILNKYSCQYYKCTNCGFIQTENPYWLDEAYGKAITDLDIGLLSRNLYYSNLLERILVQHFDCDKPCLDYAGGYGILVRMMRDKGFNYYRQDKYCENLFAAHFDVKDVDITHFEIATAFELFEHLVNPIDEVKSILHYTDSILFSTELLPNRELNTTEDWWYFAPQTGQHVAFYTLQSLEMIASQMGCNLYSDGINTHLITRRKLKGNPFHVPFLSIKWRIIPFINRLYTSYYYKRKGIQLHAKTQSDYAFIKSGLDESSI